MESIQHNDPVAADPTAVFGRRCFAYVIDFVIPVLIGMTLVARLTSFQYVGTDERAREICDLAAEQGKSEFCSASDQSVILVEPGAGTIFLGLFIYFLVALLIIPSIAGGSLGKLLLGLRVVHESSFEKAGFGGHLVRWVLLIVDSFPWFIPLTGLILGLATRGHRRVGDFAAKTLVVDKKHVGRPTLVPGVNEVAGSPISVPGLWDPPIQPPPAQPPATEPTPSAPMAEQAPATADPAPAAPAAAEPQIGDAAESAPTPQASYRAEAQQPGVDAPMWDEARDTYIQWDPELEAWMEWSESGGRWIPISQ